MASFKWYAVPLYLLSGYVFIFSGLVVNFMMLLAYIFIWPFSKDMYRKVVTSVAYTHWCQITVYAQWWSGSECSVCMEKAEDFEKFGREHVLAIMNHKFDIEWMMTWIIAVRRNILGGTKIFGKSSLRMMPLIGWAWMFTESIFLRRDWDKDKTNMARSLEKIASYPQNAIVTLLLLCEGTRFTKEKHEASNAIARKKGIPELKHHLLPRTKGFVHSMHTLKGRIPAMIDMTIGFNKNYAKPTFESIIQGKKCEAEIYMRRIPLEDVPTDTDEECAEWLHKLYREKDEIYEHFEQNGTFKIGTRFYLKKKPTDLIIWFLWAFTLSIPLLYGVVHIITSGSLTLQLGAVVACFLLYKGVFAMIDVSNIEKSSSYGKVNGHTD